MRHPNSINKGYNSIREARAKRDARVVELHHQGLTHRQIAERLGMNIATVGEVLRANGIRVRGKFKA